jgi:hypothetical protein
MIIKKTNTTIEILEGGEDLPEGEAVRVWTAEEMRRHLGLIAPVSVPAKPPAVPNQEPEPFL